MVSSYKGKQSEQELLRSLLREVDTLCEDERIMGLLPCVLDGYAHGMRNELIASKLCCVKELAKLSWSLSLRGTKIE